MTVSDLPHRDRLISEEYRLAAKAWVELDGAARMLEETKTRVLSQLMKKLGDKPAAHAERDVKASDEWGEFIEQMVSARTQANLAKVKVEWIRMRHAEWTARDANSRTERRMSR